MQLSDFQIHTTEKLDTILAELCEMIVNGKKKNAKYYGMVAAAVLDPNDNVVMGINHYNDATDNRIHAERAAVNQYQKKFGKVPAGSIIITTLSPCSEHMSDRYGESCTDFINDLGVHKVYCGYEDPTQHPEHKKFHTKCTKNKKIETLCKAFADTFLKNELNELNFLGSPCTKDCSGHRAGYEWYKRKGRDPNSWSQSFNNGAGLAKAGK